MGLSKLNGLYREVILDHANHPHNKGKLPASTNAMTLHNPTCGDTINLQINVVDNKIQDIAYNGEGCTISQASASMMTDAVKGKTTDQALAMARIKCATLSWWALQRALLKQSDEEDNNE